VLAVSGTETLLIYISAPLIVALALWVSRAIVKLLQRHQSEARGRDLFSEFMLGAEAAHGLPAKEGWIFKIDKNIEQLTAGQARTEAAVRQILQEVSDDHNGDHNLRGIVKRGAEAAGAEVVRVRRNEDEAKKDEG